MTKPIFTIQIKPGLPDEYRAARIDRDGTTELSPWHRFPGKAEYALAQATHADAWVPACGGEEKPMLTRSGLRLLYVYNHATGEHAYLNCDTDLIEPNEVAWNALGERYEGRGQ
jgi:hypothetical protein